MAVTVSQSASLTINGITPALGPGLTLLASPALAITNAAQDDYFAETFTINVSTPDTVRTIGDIVTGKILWLQTDSPISVTLTQTDGAKEFIVESFLYIITDFTQIQLSNDDAITDAHINLVVAGDRVVNPGTPGIF